jgi:hypothetical protein
MKKRNIFIINISAFSDYFIIVEIYIRIIFFVFKIKLYSIFFFHSLLQNEEEELQFEKRTKVI